MDLVEGLRTNGAIRNFTSEAVDDATLYEILDDARFAPSGGNRQPWRVAVVHDPAVRRELALVMQPVWDHYVAVRATGRTPFNVVEGGEDTDGPIERVANDLLERIDDVPVVLAIAADLSLVAMMDAPLHRPALTGGASVYPFCWSVLLAARARGLGGVLTTFASRVEPVAGPMLGLPPNHALAATIFLGHPEHRPTRLRRDPVEHFTRLDRFDGHPWP
jgi:nitroreductase